MLVALAAMGSSAFAAGIDARSYSCAALQSLIAAQGYLFISQPFGDFVVANGSFCGGGAKLERRSVETADSPACPVNYCNEFTSSEEN